MKKLYSLVALMMLGGAVMSAQAVTGTGTMTVQNDNDAGMGDGTDLNPVETGSVDASFEDNKLTLTNFEIDDTLLPLVFEIDPQTGDAIATNQLAYKEEWEEDGENYSFEYYYSDVESQTTNMYGKIANTEDGKSILTISPWGEGMDYMGIFFFIAAYYNTEIVFDFPIPGLGAETALPELTIDKVSHVVTEGEYGLISVDFTVEISAENVPEDADVQVWYQKGDDVDSLGQAVKDEDGVYTFTIGGLIPGENYTINIYAQYNTYQSEVEAYTFTVITSSITSIEMNGENARYYNLNGIEVKNPQEGQTLIKVQGSKATKVLVK